MVSEIVNKHILHCVLSSNKNLGPKTPLENINKKALPLWEPFWRRYGAQIKEQGKKAPGKAEDVAAIIFRNYCLKRNVPPFIAEDLLMKEDGQAAIKKRFELSRKKLYEKALIILKSLKRGNLVKKFLKEQFKKVFYNASKGELSFISKIPVVLTDEYINIKKNLVINLRAKGFEKKKSTTGDKYVLNLNTNKIVITLDKESDFNLVFHTIIVFTPQHVKYLLNVTDEDLKDTDKITKLAKREFRVLLDKTPLHNKLVAAIGPTLNKSIDFSTPLSEEEDKYLQTIVVDETTVANILNTYSLDYIRSIGNPVYQFNLIKYFNTKFIDKGYTPPVIWSRVLENPAEYLDPYRIAIQQEIEDNDPEVDN